MEEIRPGDVVWIRPRREALVWRSADYGDDAHRDSGKLNGKPVDWLEHVTAVQYEGRSDVS